MTTIYNVDIVGNITNNNGVLSGFGVNTYAIIQAVPGNINSFEMVIKIRTGSDVTTYQAVVGQTYTNKHALQLEVPQPNTGFICFAFPLRTDVWSAITTSFRAQPNTDYWLKMVYDGSNNIGYYSLDGENYTQVGSVSNPNGIQWDEPMELGNDQGLTPFYGSIDLNESYIKVNNVYLWKGVTEVQPLTSNYKLVKVAERKYYKYKEVTTGYRELAALTSNGSGTLDTGFYPSSNTKIRAKAIYSHYAGSYFFGHSSGTESDSFRFMRAGDTTYLDYGSGDRYNRIQGTYFTSTTDAYEFEIGNRYVKDIPTDTIKISGSTVSFSTKSYTIKIFGASYDYGTLNYMQILEDDVLERDFVPCLDVTNDIVGLYDKVNDAFYQAPNGWTGGDYVVEPGTAQDYDYYEDVDVYKAIKAVTGRNYYKYVDSPWTQPVFTSNTTWGTVSADNYSSQYSPAQYPWQALDGYTSGGDNHDFASSGSSTVNWYWDFAYPLKISSIQMWNRNNAENYGGAETYTIYGKNNDNSYEQIGTISLAAVGWVSGSTNISSAKEYYGLKINCAGTSSYAGIGEILLTATHEIAEPGTAQDYDFYEDVYSYKAIKKAEPTPPTPSGVKLMSRDPSNPTSYTIDTEYPFDGSVYIPTKVGSYNYQLKMLFNQSDNIESITYVNAMSPGYYDNSGNWHTLSSTYGTVNVSELNDFDYSRGIYFGDSFSGSYTTS